MKVMMMSISMEAVLYYGAQKNLSRFEEVYLTDEELSVANSSLFL